LLKRNFQDLLEAKMVQSLGKMTPRVVITLSLLVLLGFLGNYYALPLFFGADFLFGSSAVLLVLYFFGLRCGLVAALAVNSYTYILWGHPYGLLVFTLEALFVGLFLNGGRRNLFLLDGLFWLIIGVPLNGLIYYLVLHMDTTTTVFIVLKQGINGIFNALLVSLAINHLPMHRFLGRSQERRIISLQEITFNLLVAVVLVPALLLTTMQIRGEMRQIESTLVADLQLLSLNIQTHMNSWYRQSLNPVAELAQRAANHAMISPEELQHEVEILKTSFPDFHSLRVENASGTTVACSPAVNERGSTIGISFADREWFKGVKAGRKPVLSDVFLGNRLTLSPTVIFSMPVVKGNQFLGAATASLDLQRIYGFLKPYGKESGVKITLTDSSGRVIVSTAPERLPMQIWDRRKDGIVSPITATVYRWSPDEKHLPSMTRWNRSYFVQEIRIDRDIPWTLVIESPIAPHQKRLYAIYVQNLAIMAVLAILTMLLALALSRWLAKPLAKLATVTTGLPEKITTHQAIDWPKSEAAEIDSLIGNYQSMTQALERNFQDLEERGNALAKTNEELKIEIGDRHQAEMALRNSEAKYRSLIDNASEGILLFDLDGNIREANREMQKMLGYDKGELLHLRFSAIHPPDEMGRVNIAFEEYVRAGKGSLLNSWLQRRDGSKVPVDITASKVEYAGETIIQGIFKDITDRLQTDTERLRMTNLESLGVLAGGIAHDFNNILTAILGNISLSRIQVHDPEKAARRLENAENAATRAKDLTQQLLTFARGGEPVKKVIKVGSLLKEAAGFAIHGSAVKCEFVLADDLWPVEADEGQLSQVIHNLMLNAVQSMIDGGKITVVANNADSLPKGKRYVEISVADTGTGIPEHLQQKIYDPYFTTKQHGSGLGLATCYSIIKKHGGNITVESTLGKGTTFHISLPAAEQIAETEPVAPMEVARGKGRILVMDDEEMVREVAQASLEELGYLVECTEHGGEAVELYRRRKEEGIPFTAVIMDLTIPGGIGGKEAIISLIQIDPQVKAIVSSGYATNPIMANYREYGFSAVLSKPYRLQAMSRVLQELLITDL
jgi:PAS domain S-box-containing protein